MTESIGIEQEKSIDDYKNLVEDLQKELAKLKYDQNKAEMDAVDVLPALGLKVVDIRNVPTTDAIVEDMEHRRYDTPSQLPSTQKLGADDNESLIRKIRMSEALSEQKEIVENTERALKEELVNRIVNEQAMKLAKFEEVILAIGDRVYPALTGNDPHLDHDVHVILLYTDNSNQPLDGRVTSDHLKELIDPLLVEMKAKNLEHRLSHFSFSNTFRYYLNSSGYEVDVKINGGSQNMQFIKAGMVNLSKAMIGQGRELARHIVNTVLGKNRSNDAIKFDYKNFMKPLLPKK